MDFLSKELTYFVEKYTENEPAVLQELNRDTYANILVPRMLAGHVQGRVLSLISKMINPKNILEIGTYTGYSAICFAEGLKKGGKIHTIDINEELEEMIRHYFKKAGISDQINLYIGNAIDIIPGITETFDIVYIDADKINYENYYDLVFDKVREGGYIIADNVLWSGKVVDDPKKTDDDTKAIIKYCEKVKNDERVDNVLFPIRDGLMIARKIQ